MKRQRRHAGRRAVRQNHASRAQRRIAQAGHAEGTSNRARKPPPRVPAALPQSFPNEPCSAPPKQTTRPQPAEAGRQTAAQAVRKQRVVSTRHVHNKCRTAAALQACPKSGNQPASATVISRAAGAQRRAEENDIDRACNAEDRFRRRCAWCAGAAHTGSACAGLCLKLTRRRGAAPATMRKMRRAAPCRPPAAKPCRHPPATQQWRRSLAAGCAGGGAHAPAGRGCCKAPVSATVGVYASRSAAPRRRRKQFVRPPTRNSSLMTCRQPATGQQAGSHAVSRREMKESGRPRGR